MYNDIEGLTIIEHCELCNRMLGHNSNHIYRRIDFKLGKAYLKHFTTSSTIRNFLTPNQSIYK